MKYTFKTNKNPDETPDLPFLKFKYLNEKLKKYETFVLSNVYD
jgi:hypothetical protein